MTPPRYGRAARKAQPAVKQRPQQNKFEAPHLVVDGKRGQTAEVSYPMSDAYDAEAAPYLDPLADIPYAPQTERSRSESAPMVHAQPNRLTAKRVLDVVGAFGLAIVFSPLIAAVSLLLMVRGGSVIYRHRRVGVGGKTFECLKFRTMIPNADRELFRLLEKDEHLKAEWIKARKLQQDPRVTRVGHFLRRTSLDELPQLWNVLRGEMSLVGPRPVVREELLRYGRSVSMYLAVKPGVTGLWQATGRNDTDYRRRVAMDVYYVRNQSFGLDLYILFRTAGVVLAGNGAY